jgi:hypothetical protein
VIILVEIYFGISFLCSFLHFVGYKLGFVSINYL